MKNDTKAVRECELCLDEHDRSMKYEVMLGAWNAEEYVDLFHKEVCNDCYSRVQHAIVQLLRDKFRTKLAVLEEMHPLPVEG